MYLPTVNVDGGRERGGGGIQSKPERHKKEEDEFFTSATANLDIFFTSLSSYLLAITADLGIFFASDQ